MITKETASMLARYNAWANRVIFDAVAALPAGEPEKPRTSLFKNMVHTLNHNYVIDRIFRAHLEGRPHGYTARNTPDHPPLADLRRAQEELDAWYVRWADAIAAPALDETV
ncbi:MAG TPA: DinB family protein, partial [Burkholderiales bacterium]|nr:DinB family protein [Burkholderiales bacterium]